MGKVISAALASQQTATVQLPPAWQCVVDGSAKTSNTLFELRTFEWTGLREASVTPPSSYLELTQIRAEGKYDGMQNSRWEKLGSVRYHPAGKEFHCRWYDDKQTVMFCAFNPAFAMGYEADIDAVYLSKTFDLQNVRLFHLLARAMQELRNPGLVSDVILESLGAAAIDEWQAEFGEFLDAPLQRVRGEQLSEFNLGQIIERVREQRSPPTLTELAAENGVSVRHFNRLFKQAAGENISEAFKRERLQRAIDLLKNSALLIKEIAYLCGFKNSASFCKSFRTSHGVSPQAYRKTQS